MATEISRIGGPKTTDMKTWTVPLNTQPSRAWQKFFMENSESSRLCTPEAVQFIGQSISFASDEANVPQWVRYIDIWIVKARARHVDDLSRRDQESARRRAAEEERQGQVREANERFRDL